MSVGGAGHFSSFPAEILPEVDICQVITRLLKLPTSTNSTWCLPRSAPAAPQERPGRWAWWWWWRCPGLERCCVCVCVSAVGLHWPCTGLHWDCTAPVQYTVHLVLITDTLIAGYSSPYIHTFSSSSYYNIILPIDWSHYTSTPSTHAQTAPVSQWPVPCQTASLATVGLLRQLHQLPAVSL